MDLERFRGTGSVDYIEENGSKDVASWCKTFKQDPEILEKKFIRTNDGDRQLTNFLDNENILDEASYIDAIHSGLNDSHPELLKDIYTLQTYTV